MGNINECLDNDLNPDRCFPIRIAANSTVYSYELKSIQVHGVGHTHAEAMDNAQANLIANFNKEHAASGLEFTHPVKVVFVDLDRTSNQQYNVEASFSPLDGEPFRKGDKYPHAPVLFKTLIPRDC